MKYVNELTTKQQAMVVKMAKKFFTNEGLSSQEIKDQLEYIIDCKLDDLSDIIDVNKVLTN